MKIIAADSKKATTVRRDSVVTIETLTELLDDAIGATRVDNPLYGVASSELDIDTYRTLLLSCRTSNNISHRRLAQICRPVVQDSEIKRRMKDVVTSALVEHIHEDRIQSAVFAVRGGAVGGFVIDDLLEHWLDIAIARGSSSAAAAFLTGIQETAVPYQQMALLKGLRIEREIEVVEGVRLVPLPNNPSKFPPYMPEMDSPTVPTPATFTLDTVLIVDASVSPVFVNPQRMENNSDPFTRRNIFSEEGGFHMAQFCEALSLVGNGAARCAVWWKHVDEDHICNVRTSYGYGYDPITFNLGGPVVTATKETVAEAMALYRSRKRLSAPDAKRLVVPVDRWIRSLIDASIIDRFIDVGIALESLYLNDGNNSELRFRLALRAAWHLGSSASDRLRLMATFRKIYDARSKAVHTGTVPSGAETGATLTDAQELCRRSAIKFIEDGEFPDWDRIVVNQAIQPPPSES